MSPGERFIRGLTAPWRGVALLRGHRELWSYAVAPVLITSVLLFVAFFATLWCAGPFTRWLAPGLVRWWLLFLIARSAMLLLLGLLFGTTSMMLSALLCLPIHDALSARIEALKGVLPAPLSFREALPTSIAHSVAGFSLWILLESLLFPVQLIPMVGALIELVLGFGLTAFFLAHQLMDGPMSRRQLSFAEKLHWLWANLGYVLGLGTMGTLMIAVPLLNVVGLPIAIVGGTLLFIEIEEN